MKGKFDAYALWPLAKKFQNWIVDRSTARNFTVFEMTISMGSRSIWNWIDIFLTHWLQKIFSQTSVSKILGNLVIFFGDLGWFWIIQMALHLLEKAFNNFFNVQTKILKPFLGPISVSSIVCLADEAKTNSSKNNLWNNVALFIVCNFGMICRR